MPHLSFQIIANLLINISSYESSNYKLTHVYIIFNLTKKLNPIG